MVGPPENVVQLTSSNSCSVGSQIKSASAHTPGGASATAVGEGFGDGRGGRGGGVVGVGVVVGVCVDAGIEVAVAVAVCAGAAGSPLPHADTRKAAASATNAVTFMCGPYRSSVKVRFPSG